MSLGLSKQPETGPQLKKQPRFLTSFCLQNLAPPLSQLQSQAGILFIIFCRASHAIFIKRRKGKSKGSACERGKGKKENDFMWTMQMATQEKGGELGSTSIHAVLK